jgi:hypothetical protein
MPLFRHRIVRKVMPHKLAEAMFVYDRGCGIVSVKCAFNKRSARPRDAGISLDYG